jgi:hypothetical protein
MFFSATQVADGKPPRSAVERLSRLVVEQLDHQIGELAVVLQPDVAALGHRPSQRAQHERGDVVDAVDHLLIARDAEIVLVKPGFFAF